MRRTFKSLEKFALSKGMSVRKVGAWWDRSEIIIGIFKDGIQQCGKKTIAEAWDFIEAKSSGRRSNDGLTQVFSVG